LLTIGGRIVGELEVEEFWAKAWKSNCGFLHSGRQTSILVGLSQRAH